MKEELQKPGPQEGFASKWGGVGGAGGGENE